MAITAEPIIKYDVDLKIGTVITRWATFRLALVSAADIDVNVADSAEDEIVISKTRIEGTCTGMLGALNNAGTLPFPGDVIAAADLTALVGSDSILFPISTYTNIKVVFPFTINADSDPLTWEINFRSGVRRILLPS